MLVLKRIYKEKDAENPVLPGLKEKRGWLSRQIEACSELAELAGVSEVAKLREKLEAELAEVRAEQEKRFAGVVVEKAIGPSGVHHMTPNWLELGLAEGWLRLEGSQLSILDVDGGVVAYKVEARPGYYCCHCSKKLGDGAGRVHVEAAHKNAKSPDAQNPAGYRKDNFYVLTPAKEN